MQKSNTVAQTMVVLKDTKDTLLLCSDSIEVLEHTQMAVLLSVSAQLQRLAADMRDVLTDKTAPSSAEQTKRMVLASIDDTAATLTTVFTLLPQVDDAELQAKMLLMATDVAMLSRTLQTWTSATQRSTKSNKGRAA